MYLIQAPHQLTIFRTIPSFSSVQYSESYVTPSKWEGCQETQAFLQWSLRFTDERLIRVYFDRISSQARNWFRSHYYSAYPSPWWILCCLVTGTKITSLTNPKGRTTFIYTYKKTDDLERTTSFQRLVLILELAFVFNARFVGFF